MYCTYVPKVHFASEPEGFYLCTSVPKIYFFFYGTRAFTFALGLAITLRLNLSLNRYRQEGGGT